MIKYFVLILIIFLAYNFLGQTIKETLFGYGGNVKVGIWEGFLNNANGLHPTITITTTDDSFTPSCQTLNHSLSVVDKKIRLWIGNKISTGTFCLPSWGPAYIDQQVAVTEGENILEVVEKGKTDTYKIIVTKDHVVLEPITTSFSSLNPRYTISSRIPGNLIWAVCNYNEDFNNPKPKILNYCENFYNQIQAISRPSPYLDNDRTHYFLFDGDKKELIGLLERNKNSSYQTYITISSGETFYCYQNPCEPPTFSYNGTPTLIFK